MLNRYTRNLLVAKNFQDATCDGGNESGTSQPKLLPSHAHSQASLAPSVGFTSPSWPASSILVVLGAKADFGLGLWGLLSLFRVLPPTRSCMIPISPSAYIWTLPSKRLPKWSNGDSRYSNYVRPLAGVDRKSGASLRNS